MNTSKKSLPWMWIGLSVLVVILFHDDTLKLVFLLGMIGFMISFHYGYPLHELLRSVGINMSGSSLPNESKLDALGNAEILSWKQFFILLFLSPQVILLQGWITTRFPDSLVGRYPVESTFVVFLAILVSMLFVYSRSFLQEALSSRLIRLALILVVIGVCYGAGLILAIFENGLFCALGHCVFR